MAWGCENVFRAAPTGQRPYTFNYELDIDWNWRCKSVLLLLLLFTPLPAVPFLNDFQVAG